MLLDNKNHEKVISELRENAKADAKFSVLCGLFSIYDYPLRCYQQHGYVDGSSDGKGMMGAKQ